MVFGPKELKNKKVVIMGLGLYEKGSGGMAAAFFARRGARVLVTDLRPAKVLKPAIKRLKKYRNIKYVFGQHRLSDFQKADIVFQNPSVPANSPYLAAAKKSGTLIINDWSIFLSLYQPKVFIGVTGTRGKSTTTALIYEMLKKHYSPLSPTLSHKGRGRSAKIPLPRWEGLGEGDRVRGKVWLAGNLGVSPLSFIDSYHGEPIVAELSSWLLHHFSDIKKSPNVAVVTNIMNDHMDKYASPKEYIADKENIFKFQKLGDAVVLNWDNKYTREMAKKLKSEIRNPKSETNSKFQIPNSKVIWFSLKKHLPKWVPLKSVKLLGGHNLANALAASAATEAVGVSRKNIIAVLKSFRGLPERLELVRVINGVKYYNDTTATTPDAAIAALKALGQTPHLSSPQRGEGWGEGAKQIILIAGGADKKLEFKELAKNIKKYCKAVVLLPGTATEKLKLKIKNLKLKISEAQSMQEAVVLAINTAVKKDIVLLSPAAASFGLFKNEFDRGAQFVKEVKRI